MIQSDALACELAMTLSAQPLDVAAAALVVARIECAALDPAPTIAALDRWGALARARVDALGDAPIRARLDAINQVIYGHAGFDGNRASYGDFRNSLLNVVVQRRLGIPITLALVYMEVARRAGVEVFGVSFPGHFLLRVPDDAGRDGSAVILDPFSGGREMDEAGCQQLLARHLGDAAQLDPSLLQPCGSRQMIARLINNLKRVYIELRSFPQARLATDLMLVIEPGFGSALRDRGLIAYHLDDFQPALRDLEQYLQSKAWDDADDEERKQVQEHVRTLRGRMAGLN